MERRWERRIEEGRIKVKEVYREGRERMEEGKREIEKVKRGKTSNGRVEREEGMWKEGRGRIEKGGVGGRKEGGVEGE